MENVIKKMGFEDRSKYDWVKKYKAIYDNFDTKTKVSNVTIYLNAFIYEVVIIYCLEIRTY